MKPVKIYVCVYIYIIVKSTYQSVQGMTFCTSVKCTTYIRLQNYLAAASKLSSRLQPNYIGKAIHNC